MPTAPTDDVTYVHASINQIIRLAFVELPGAAQFGVNALTCTNRADAVRMLDRMHTAATDADCEYLAELIEMTMLKLDDTVGWAASPN